MVFKELSIGDYFKLTDLPEDEDIYIKTGETVAYDIYSPCCHDEGLLIECDLNEQINFISKVCFSIPKAMDIFQIAPTDYDEKYEKAKANGKDFCCGDIIAISNKNYVKTIYIKVAMPLDNFLCIYDEDDEINGNFVAFEDLYYLETHTLKEIKIFEKETL